LGDEGINGLFLMELRILNANEVRQALPMIEAIAGMKAAFAQLSQGQAEVPLRSRVPVPAHNGVSIFMPAYLAESDDLAVKVVSVFPDNARRGQPVIYGLVLVLDASSGRPLALLEGGALTAIRTGAASGAATDLLARPDTAVAAIIGCGVQARTQLEAVCTVRPIQEVRVYSIDRAQAETFAAEMAGVGPIPLTVQVVDGPQAAVSEADIVCTATTSTTPVFHGRDLKPGAHVNAVGAYTPEMQEVDVETIRRSLVVVDSRASVLAEAGDLMIPLAAGEIQESHIHAELGEIVAGTRPGRTHSQQITTFKSVGVAVQDAVAARIALAGAARRNLGTLVEM
jgi:ornithine cyclodeaminase/alanine dehydrogenase-like protein (mu-crystallin family)